MVEKKINEDKLIELYSTHSQYELAKIFNCTISIIYLWADKLGLTNERTCLVKEKDKEKFIEAYNTMSRHEVAKLFNIHTNTVRLTAKKYNCYKYTYKPAIRFTKEELSRFEEIATTTTTQDLMTIFNKNRTTICNLRKKRNLYLLDENKKENSFNKTQNRYLKKFGSEENIKLFIELFPYIGNNDLMELFGISEKAIYTAAEFFNCEKREPEFFTLALKYSGIDRRTSEERQIYFTESNWKRSMYNYIDNLQTEHNFKLVGIYHNKNNKTGLVRDHIYSRYEGHLNGIFPEIIRHPANCQLLTITQNTRKSSKSHISLEDLFNKILSFKKEWYEQDRCIELIKRYKLGERWICEGGKRQDELFIEKYSKKDGL